MDDSALVHMPNYTNSVDNEEIEEPIMEFTNFNSKTSVNTVAVQINKQNQLLRISTGILALMTLLFLFLFVYFYSTLNSHSTEIRTNDAAQLVMTEKDKLTELNEMTDIVRQYELQQREKVKRFKKPQNYQWTTIVDSFSQKSSMPFELDDYDNDVEIVIDRSYIKYDMHLNFSRLNEKARVSKIYYTINNSDGDITNVTSLCKVNETQYHNKQFPITFYSLALSGYILDIRLKVESLDYSSQSFSTDGTLMWKIHLSEINDTKANVKTLDSPYFYTEHGGYRMILQLHRPLFSFQLSFICSENDKNLPEIFSFRATFTMFNQDNPDKNLVVSNDYHNGPVWSSYSFSFDYDHIEKANFIKNDVVFVKLLIQPLPSD